MRKTVLPDVLNMPEFSFVTGEWWWLG